MARNSRFISYGFLIFLILVIIGGGYYLYKKYGSTHTSPVDAIPANSGAFIRLDEPGELIRSLSEKNAIWQDLLGAGQARGVLTDLMSADSILMSRGYKEMLEQGSIYLALENDSAGMAACILFEWPYGASEDDLDGLLTHISGRALQKKSMSFLNTNGHSMNDSAGSYCYYFIDHGLCVIGNTAGIVNNCVQRMNDESALPDPDQYSRVSSTSGHNVDANIYINFARLPELARSILSSSYHADSKILPDFGSWSEIDLLIKNEEILMNGYTETIDTLNQFLSIFDGQEPQKIEITRILPYNTSLLLNFGFGDIKKLYQRNAVYLSNGDVFPERESMLANLKNKLGPNIEEYMTSWVGNEIALAVINPHLRDQKNNTFMAIHARDIDLATRKLRELSSIKYTYTYRDYTIQRITDAELIPALYGRMFSIMQENYYTQLEDYVVFANSAKSLENFINIFLSGKTLEQNENFKKFTDNVSDRSNLFCYLNVRNSTELLQEVLSDQLSSFIKENRGVVKNFEAMAVQFKALNNMYFTSVYVKHNPAFIQEDLSIWKAYLDAPVHGQPYFVKDHRTNNLKIVAFDTINNMYLIDHDGNIVWKLNLGEKVISDVHTVDYYKNGKIQYLFNTENRIYLIDLLGRDVEGYPVSLRDKATNGLAVFDYDHNRDYRILLALDDNRVYNYNMQGKKVDGWKKPLSKGRVTMPVQHLRDGGKDYLIIADAEGNVKITDRRGKERIKLKSSIINSIHSEFYVNETNSKGVILTTDNEGMLKYIKTNGKLETTDFGNFSKDHYFLYEDFDNKGGKDFIYLDENKLTVFDRFKNIIFSHQFQNEIHSSPVIIPVSSREKLIGVVSEESGKIYLFNRQGKLLSTPDHIGKTRMLIGSLNRDGQLNLISGSGNTIYNYYFR
ncbi:MAG: DUF3352 domain-containing protein [Bacteroidota bacterium]